MRRDLTGAAAASVLLVVTGCGGSNAAPSGPLGGGPASQAPRHAPSPKPQGAATEATSSVLKIWQFAFTGPGSVRAGATVTVKNEDSVTHTVTADGGAFDVVVPADSTKTFTAPSKPGSYRYHCTYHRSMHGTLKVT